MAAVIEYTKPGNTQNESGILQPGNIRYPITCAMWILKESGKESGYCGVNDTHIHKNKICKINVSHAVTSISLFFVFFRSNYFSEDVLQTRLFSVLLRNI